MCIQQQLSKSKSNTTHSQYKEKSTNFDENLPAEKGSELEHEEQIQAGSKRHHGHPLHCCTGKNQQ